MASNTITCKVVVTNKRALRALEYLADLTEELEEDLPWRPDIAKARRAARYALKHIDLVPDDGGG